MLQEKGCTFEKPKRNKTIMKNLLTHLATDFHYAEGELHMTLKYGVGTIEITAAIDGGCVGDIVIDKSTNVPYPHGINDLLNINLKYLVWDGYLEATEEEL